MIEIEQKDIAEIHLGLMDENFDKAVVLVDEN
jgi:hypothetical protein